MNYSQTTPTMSIITTTCSPNTTTKKSNSIKILFESVFILASVAIATSITSTF
jgi:hypothetical protein